MKTLSLIVFSSVVLALAGCDNNKGGSTDQRDSNSGSNSNMNYIRESVTNDYQGGALNPSRTTTGRGFSNPDYGTNDVRRQTIDPERTNSLPQN